MLSVSNLHRPGLLPVSFELAEGECISIMGPSGSGKSLLLRTLADLDPSTGNVFLDGCSRWHFPAPHWRRQVTYLPAESGWWNERVGDHFPHWQQAEPLIAALNLPATCRGWPIQRLSTGERQRLALIRALIHRPRIVLLDEPTSGLDRSAVTAVEHLLESHLQTGMSMLWVTHDPDQARRMASRHFAVEAGRVYECSPNATP